MHPLNQRVEQAFARWQERRQQLQDTSRELEAALEAFAHGRGTEPTQLREDLETLRIDCDRLFNEVLAAVAAAKEAGVR